MPPEPTDKLTDEERQRLVAFLDGELGEEEARAVEAGMSRRPEVRQEADALKRAWDLLDYLPRPQAPGTFTSRTLEKVDALRLTTHRGQRRRVWLGRVAWAACFLILAGGGFLGGYQWPRPEPVQPTAEESRVLEHRDYWRLYELAEDVEFLRELDRPDLFGEGG